MYFKNKISFKILLGAAWLGLALLLALFVKDIGYDNDNWLDDDNPHQQAYNLLTKEFEDFAEQLLVVIDLRRDFFSDEVISRVNQLTDELLAIENIKNINSPLEATVIVDGGAFLQIQSYRNALTQGSIEDYRQYHKLLTESQYYGLLISKDYSHIVLNVTVDSWKKNDIRVRVAADIDDVLLKYNDLGKISVAGNLRLKNDLNAKTQNELKRLLKLSAVILSLFLLLIFGRFWRVGLLIGTAMICVMSALAVILLFGHDLTIIALTLPVMIIVIATSDCLHLLGYWDNFQEKHSADGTPRLAIVKEVIAYGWRPCLNTSITTAIGFGSFALSDILPLREFGRDAAIAVMVSYVIMMTAMTSGLLFISRNPRPRLAGKLDHGMSHFLRSLISYFLLKHNGKIIISSLIVVTISGLALLTARTETNLLDVFFKKHSEIYRAFSLVDEKLGGSGSVDVIFTSRNSQKGREYFRKLQAFQNVQQLEQDIIPLPLVQGVQSYLLPVREAHKKFAHDNTTNPDTAEELGQELLFLDFSRSDRKQDVLAPYLDFDAEKIRVKIQLPNLSSTDLAVFLTSLDDILQKNPLPNAVTTGHSTFFQILSSYVVTTQLFSIVVTLGVIFLLLAVQFGPRLAVIGIFATAAPVMVTLGTISLLGLPFDFATVIIAAIAIGISIDDNIHILHFYKTAHKDQSKSDSIAQALMVPGRAVIQTTCIIILGIGIFISSDLVILERFGFFASEALFLAWFSSMLLLPALLEKLTR